MADGSRENIFPVIRPCGDTAMTVVLGNEISEKINDRVFALYRALQAAPFDGLVDMVPSFASLLVSFDPSKISSGPAKEAVLKAVDSLTSAAGGNASHIWNIPCCYSRRFAPDLESVARHAEISEEEVVRRHQSGLYRIYMLGFLPGFVYLGGLDPAIACPRLPSPRKKIPQGAVGIGGSQTGIYPLASPGGWRLIGSTPIRMYDPCRSDPVLCRPGDYIRFVPVTTCQYYDIARDVTNGVWKPD